MSARTCPTCGSELTPEGGCPRCLLELGLQAVDPEAPTPSETDGADDSPAVEQIGAYRLLRTLGEGGMGTVYLAEQKEPIERQVALKIIKAGMDSAEVIARFESERQALALMSHPNIAKVLDAGTTPGGRPYFVMEYVPGAPITRYCDDHRLGARERLELLLPVCRAIQHAHQKGIIHRDLKPSNVLVSLEDGAAQPKVIDFGVAKATQQRLTEKTLFTQHGLIVGTPAYMSPEQADAGALDIDTTTDIYSLGVLLYELLTGVLPFDPEHLRQASYGEMQRIIREEEPARPSTRVGHLGGTATDVARRRHTDPPSLVRRLRGDLDWIALKCLEKDRTRRYQSATELAADLERHLGNEPIEASPPSMVYRLRKMVARHKVGFASGVSVVLLLIALAATMSVQAARIARERDRAVQAEEQARTEAETAKEVTDFLIEIFEVSDPSQTRGNTITAREVLDRGAERIEKELADQPEVKSRMEDALGRVHHALGLYEPAREMLESSLETRRVLFGDESNEVAESLATLVTLLHRARTGYADPAGAGGWDQELAEAYAREALDIWRHLYGEQSLEAARGLELVAWQLSFENREGREALVRDALEIRRAILGSEHPLVAETMKHLGHILSWRGRDWAGGETFILQALELQRRVLGEDHPSTIDTLQTAANLYIRMHSWDLAERYYRQVVALSREALGQDHPLVTGSLAELASAVGRQGDWQGAVDLVLEAIALQGDRPGAYSPDQLKWVLSFYYRETGQLAEAESLLAELLLDHRREADRSELALTAWNLSELLADQGKLADAEALCREALAIPPDEWNPYHHFRASYLLARVLESAGRDDEAKRAYAEALEQHSGVVEYLKRFGRAEGDRGALLESLRGGCLLGLGRHSEAEAPLVNAYETLERIPTGSMQPFNIRKALDRVIRLYDTWGKPDKAAEYRALRGPGYPDPRIQWASVLPAQPKQE